MKSTLVLLINQTTLQNSLYKDCMERSYALFGNCLQGLSQDLGTKEDSCQTGLSPPFKFKNDYGGLGMH